MMHIIVAELVGILTKCGSIDCTVGKIWGISVV